MKYLITGGLGFIGQHLAHALIKNGNSVVIVDCLSPQVHRWDNREYHGDEIIICDFADIDFYKDHIFECEHLIHLAAETGTGQSMYQADRYVEQNISKFAKLLTFLSVHKPPLLKTISLASSRSVYGEGTYQCLDHGKIMSPRRTDHDLSLKVYEPRCPECQLLLNSIPTSETDLTFPLSVYATTKLAQENLLLNMISSMDVVANIFRFQNVYGEGQSLSNPYTGILAIFSNLAREAKQLRIFEDGNESRDFIHVKDVCDIVLEVISKNKESDIFNVGTGVKTSVLSVAEKILEFTESKGHLEITHEYRLGDIRHNTANMWKTMDLIGQKQMIKFNHGLERFLNWANENEVGNTRDYYRSLEELKRSGVMSSND